MAGLAALIWDVDGVLLESEELHRAAFNTAFSLAGLSWRWDKATYGRLLQVAGGKERIAHYVQTAEKQQEAGADLDDFARRLHARKTALFHEKLQPGRVGFRPGVLRMLRAAQVAGLAQSIATTTSRANVEALLRAMPHPPPLDGIVAGEDVTRKKPHPEAYELVLERLGRRPEECLAVEDSVLGLHAALAAGVKTVITPSLYTAGEDFSGAVAVVEHLGDPGRPARLLAGVDPWSGGQGMVDVPALRAWHGHA